MNNCTFAIMNISGQCYAIKVLCTTFVGTYKNYSFFRILITIIKKAIYLPITIITPKLIAPCTLGFHL